jgi:O-antigen/teichoic acid export membrane protein
MINKSKGTLEHLVQLAKDSAIYGLSQAGAAFVGLVLLPILTRAFSPAEYGVIGLISPGITLLTLVTGLQIVSGAARYYYETKDESRRTLLSTGLFLSLPFPLLICLGALPWVGQISQLLFASPVYGKALSFALFSVILRVVFGYLLLILRFERSTVKYSILAVGNLTLMTLLSIYFVVSLHKGVEGVFLGFFLADLLFTIVAFLLLRKRFTLALSVPFTKDILSYSIPIVLLPTASWFRTYIYRFLLLPMVGLTGVGIFSSGANVSMVILLLTSSFRLAWGPFAMSVMHEENHRLIYSKVLTYFTVAIVAVAFLLTLFSREIIHLLLPPSYWEAYRIVGLLAAALVLNGIFVMVGIGTIIVKRPYLDNIAFLIGIASGVGCLVVLTPHIGIMGAAIATLLGSAIALAIEFYLAQRNYYIGYEWKRLLSILLLLLIFIPLIIFIDGIEDTGLRLGLKMVGLGLFSLGVWRSLQKEEISAGLKFLSQKVASSKIRFFTNFRGKK